MQGLGFYPAYPSVAVSRMITEDSRLLGQRQKMVFYSLQNQQPECQHDMLVHYSPKSHEVAQDRCLPRQSVALQERNTELGGLPTFMVSRSKPALCLGRG